MPDLQWAVANAGRAKGGYKGVNFDGDAFAGVDLVRRKAREILTVEGTQRTCLGTNATGKVPNRLYTSERN